MNRIASIAISTWKRCEMLAELLVSLECQTVPRDFYQIDVYDSGSPDRTRQVVEEFGELYGNVRYIDARVNTLAHKRNVAICETTTPIIILLDDDLLAAPELVESHIKANQQTSGVVFCGQVRFPSRLVRHSNYFRYRDSRHLGGDRDTIDYSNLPFRMIVAMNMSAKTDELRTKAGLFSEDFVAYGCEDHEYGYRLARAGFRLAYLEKALVIHREGSHGIAEYSNKIRTTARVSIPILKRLVPPSELTSSSFYFEPDMPNEGLYQKIRRQAIQIVMNRHAATAIQRYLEATDHIPELYAPALFHYLLAYAYYEGVQSRSEAIEQPT